MGAKLTNLGLPALDPLSEMQMRRMQQHLQASILSQPTHTLSFADYMQQALYAPGLGYYSAGAQKFGAAGDFITAPELSPLFSQCIARQCQQVLAQLGGGDILEWGAGSGTMAAEILHYLKQHQCLPNHYYILEVSADLRARQQEKLIQLLGDDIARVVWLSVWPQQPIRGVMLANEVLDAMPVTIFHQQDQLYERCVSWRGEQFGWCDKAADVSLIEVVEALKMDFSLGYISEINLWLPAWIAELSNCLEAGIAILIDYGFPRSEYYHPQRNQGTLMCHFRHYSHADPLILPGIQDITAHVDFTAVAEAAVAAGMQVVGFTQQAAFLLNLGLTDLMLAAQQEAAKNMAGERGFYGLTQAIKRLTLPSEMGELFKVIALAKNYDHELIGFSNFNYLAKL